MSEYNDTLIADACGICVNNELQSFSIQKRNIGAFARHTITKRINKNNVSGMTISRKRLILITAAVILILALTACAVVPAVRSAIKGIFTYVFYGGIIAETSEGVDHIERIMLPSYSPEGFERSVTYSKGMTYAEYTDGTRTYSFSQLVSDYTTLFKGNEIKSADVVMKSGASAKYIEMTDNTSALIWTDGEYQYLLSGQFGSYDELTEIAESVALYEE